MPRTTIRPRIRGDAGTFPGHDLVQRNRARRRPRARNRSTRASRRRARFDRDGLDAAHEGRGEVLLRERYARSRRCSSTGVQDLVAGTASASPEPPPGCDPRPRRRAAASTRKFVALAALAALVVVLPAAVNSAAARPSVAARAQATLPPLPPLKRQATAPRLSSPSVSLRSTLATGTGLWRSIRRQCTSTCPAVPS
jgi:hypothetical protein